tara:strand:- start:380 stop:496 length:117 start_codon:yes stop_codon:yes gene_type:complete
MAIGELAIAEELRVPLNSPNAPAVAAIPNRPMKKKIIE